MLRTAAPQASGREPALMTVATRASGRPQRTAAAWTEGGAVGRRQAAWGNDQCEKNGSRKTNAKQKKNKISFCRIITY